MSLILLLGGLWAILSAAGESLPEPANVDGWSFCQLTYKYPATRYRVFGATVALQQILAPRNCYQLMAADSRACQSSEWSRPDFAVLLMQTDDDTLRLKIITDTETLESGRNRTENQLQLFVDGLPFPLNSTRLPAGRYCTIVPEKNGTVVTVQNPDIWARFDGSSLDLRLRRAGASANACGRCDAAGRLTREDRTVHLLYRNGWLPGEPAICRREQPLRPIVWNEDQADEERAKRMGLSAKCELNATQSLRLFNGNQTMLSADNCYTILAMDVFSCTCGFVEQPQYVVLARRLNDKQIVLKLIDNGEIVTIKRYSTASEPLKLKAERSLFKDAKFDQSCLQLMEYQSHYDIYSSDFFIYFDGERVQLRLSQATDRPAICGACFGGNRNSTILAWLTRKGALNDQPAGCPTAKEFNWNMNVSISEKDRTPLSRRMPPVQAHLIEIEPERVCSSVWPEDTCVEPYRPVYLPAQPFYAPSRRHPRYNITVYFRCYDWRENPDASRLNQLDTRLKTAFQRYSNFLIDQSELDSEVFAIRSIADEIDVSTARKNVPASYDKTISVPSYCILKE